MLLLYQKGSFYDLFFKNSLELVCENRKLSRISWTRKIFSTKMARFVAIHSKATCINLSGLQCNIEFPEYSHNANLLVRYLMYFVKITYNGIINKINS